MATMTLAEKVYSVVAAEGINYIDDRLRVLPGGRLGEFEQDLRDWGMVYGVALGIARTEDLWESLESVSERAQAAALEAFKRLSGEFEEPMRSIDPLVDEVLIAYEVDKPGEYRELRDAVCKLGNRVGWPTRDEKAAA